MDQWDRRVKRILLDSRGREALGKYGINVDFAEERPKNPIVAVLVPTYRAPEPRMTASMNKMMEFTRRSGEVTIYSGASLQAGVIHWARNWLITKLLEEGQPWTHLLLCDDDMVLEEDTVLRLLAHKKDIVGGLCVRRNDPPVPTIRAYDKETGAYDQIWEWPQGELFEVGSIGTGVLLISKHAVEQVGQAYFDCLWEKEFYGVSEEWAKLEGAKRLKYFDDTKNCFWFRFLPSRAQAIEMGEDTSFCHIAREYCGMPIYCDGDVQPGHLGSYPFSVSDFIPHQANQIEIAKREGRYKSQARIEPELQIVG